MALEKFADKIQEPEIIYDISPITMTLEQRRQMRRDNCGTWLASFDEQTGRGIKRRIFCHEWRTCQTCLEQRVWEQERDFGHYFSARMTDTINIYHTTETEWRKYSKDHPGKWYYKRFPQMGDTCILLLDHTVRLGEPITPDELIGLDWGVILRNIPETERVTGNLGKHTPKAVGVVEVGCLKIINEASFEPHELKIIQRQCIELAAYQTCEICPASIFEIQAVLNKRIKLTCDFLEKCGAQVEYISYKKTITDLNDVDWSIYNRYVKYLFDIKRTSRLQAILLAKEPVTDLKELIRYT